MERRHVLHEKLKGSKQKKMTIKQGDCLVTLNLKTDIIDPTIDLSDKVLFMLEAYAEKQAKSKITTSPTIKEPEIKLVSKFRSKDRLISPSKRVRFDLGTENKDTEQPKIDESLEATIESPTTESVIKKPNKKRIEDYFKTIPSPPKISVKTTDVVIKENAPNKEALEIINGEPVISTIVQEEPKEAEVVENQEESLLNNSQNNQSSNNTSNNSSNNTLDELLDELDKTNTQLVQVN